MLIRNFHLHKSFFYNVLNRLRAALENYSFFTLAHSTVTWQITSNQLIQKRTTTRKLPLPSSLFGLSPQGLIIGETQEGPRWFTFGFHSVALKALSPLCLSSFSDIILSDENPSLSKRKSAHLQEPYSGSIRRCNSLYDSVGKIEIEVDRYAGSNLCFYRSLKLKKRQKCQRNVDSIKSIDSMFNDQLITISQLYI